MRRRRRNPAWLPCLPVCLLAGPPVYAHNFSITDVLVVFKADDTYLIDIRVDLDALALGVSSTVPSAEIAAALSDMRPDDFDRAVERARSTLLKRVWIFFGDRKVSRDVTFPDQVSNRTSASNEPTILGVTARFHGRIPTGETDFQFMLSRAFGAVQLTILDQAITGGAVFVLGPGEKSPVYVVHQPQVEDRGAVFGRYLFLGFEHIIPAGADHVLFVLGLFLLAARIRPLLMQITAFTVAHSVTLGLSMANVAALPSYVVEPLIAVSIAYVAIENVMVGELKPWRPALVFAFGLLHGMGFAGVLRELGLPAQRFGAALAGFNIGVEAGQLCVVVSAFALLGWFRDRRWYRRAVTIPLSLLIAAIGAFWAFQRTGLIP